MRGRKARGLTLEAEDAAALRQVARGQSLPWFQVRRARTVLAVADGDRVDAVDLQPHRTRYWRTPRLDERFRERAEKVLWCYANAARLAERGIWTVCTD